jgi:hypothetical protein
MHHARWNILGIGLLGLVLAIGSFVGGYLLMSPGAVPEMPATRAGPADTAPAAARGLVITKAVYGDLPDGNATDVTSKVAAMVAHNALTVVAINGNFGDPAEGIVKKLRVEYTIDGVPASRTVDENATLTIKGDPIRLVIKKAVYGDLPDGSFSDVTTKVAQAAEGDTLSIAANNDTFGDPASGIFKKLRVEYTFDGKDRSKTVSENETLAISNAGE